MPAFAQTPAGSQNSAAAPAATAPTASPATASAPTSTTVLATTARSGPSPYSAIVQKGDRAFAARDFDTAIAAYREEIQKKPNGALGHYRLGEAELAKGNFEEAEKSWQTALRLAGKDEATKSKLLLVLADLKERQKAYDEGVERWKSCAEHAQATGTGYPATATERIKRADEWKKISADAAEVKARIQKRIQEADESMKKSSK
jgi:tetratricopeptide (TPR) repeat protein